MVQPILAGIRWFLLIIPPTGHPSIPTFHTYRINVQTQIHSIIRPWGNANFVGGRYFGRNAKLPVGVGFEVGTCSCDSLLSGGALLHHIVSIFSRGQPNYSTRLEKECRRAILMFTLGAYCSVGEVYKF
ncbi:hypothetical protein I7I50_00946 [Histoplasma capsulatum G186AR]|uniref:Uncharacterized protein n=1 Tax=Ajellomyces capsulatus TaxID=5037 RepID=A0A8H8CW69_AJECA|nr:hypothetical protein I7I52_08212 [Histoplasma capsulatum]QSS72946.1 hypothetical protein I7I50_00946 [Histoplasma capsulatum G186AR]